ncbi:S1 family peptidase [Microvirga antarctica]|uniref:S1 family peptidase n=1 Tax=Microvirga antarctica TaxID=2819233 RepID=UPI0031B9AF29
MAVALLAGPANAVVLGTPSRDTNGVRRAVVAVENSAGELCTGVLIAQDLVMTAAHCMLDEASYRIVSVSRAFKTAAVNVMAIAIHPAFVRGTTPRTQPGVDLAVLKLERPLGSDFVPMDPRLATRIEDDDLVTIAGFGVLAENLKRSARTLRQTLLVSVGTVEVSNRVQIAVDRNRLAETTGAGACRGDSGGPVLTGRASDYRLSGIVSWSSGPLKTTQPSACGGLTAVTPLVDHQRWIADATRRLGGREGAWTRQ